MEDVKDLRMEERQGAGAVLDQLMNKIPGYAGYREREQRREADQRHREFVAKRLTAKKKALLDIGEILMSGGGLSHLEQLDGLTSVLDRLIERTRHASAGFSSFADTNVVDTERLDRIYEHDLGLLEQVEGLDEAIGVLERAADTQDNVAQAMRNVKRSLETVDGLLDSRDKIMKGLE